VYYYLSNKWQSYPSLDIAWLLNLLYVPFAVACYYQCLWQEFCRGYEEKQKGLHSLWTCCVLHRKVWSQKKFFVWCELYNMLRCFTTSESDSSSSDPLKPDSYVSGSSRGTRVHRTSVCDGPSGYDVPLHSPFRGPSCYRLYTSVTRLYLNVVVCLFYCSADCLRKINAFDTCLYT